MRSKWNRGRTWPPFDTVEHPFLPKSLSFLGSDLLTHFKSLLSLLILFSLPPACLLDLEVSKKLLNFPLSPQFSHMQIKMLSKA